MLVKKFRGVYRDLEALPAPSLLNSLQLLLGRGAWGGVTPVARVPNREIAG